MAPGEDMDSGVESLPTSSKDMTPEKPKALPGDDDDEDFDIDETLAERLWGLTEMFPESVRDLSYKLTVNTISGMKSFYGLSRTVVWAVASSSVILFAPVVFELERYQMKQMQENRDKQVLLGPSSAMNMTGGPPPPPVAR